MTSSTTASTTYQSEPGGGPASPNATRFLALFFIGALVAVTLLLGRAEVSRWYHAKARNAVIDQRYGEAVEAANAALDWDPDSPELVELRAYVRMQDSDFEGCIADFDEMLAKAAEDGEQNDRDFAPLAQKSTALQRLGRHAEAVAIWSDIIAYRKEEYRLRDDYESQYAYAMSLNNRAYMVGQAYSVVEDKTQFDIQEALEQIRLAIEIRDVPDDAVMLDTLGYLLLLNGAPTEATKHLEEAVAMTQQENAAQRSRIQRAMQAARDQRPLQDALASLDKQYSIILHHRGEAYEAMGEQEKAKADLEEAMRLGFDPAQGIW